MRIIDADALSAFIGDLRSTLHKEQTTFRAMTDIEFNTRDYMLLHFQYVINNAPTVDTYTEDDVKEAIKAGFQDGYEMAKAKFERPTGKWIPVSERLPLIGEAVLCQCRANIFEVLKLTNDGWLYDNRHCYMMPFVIAWMPLPEPYKEAEND